MLVEVFSNSNSNHRGFKDGLLSPQSNAINPQSLRHSDLNAETMMNNFMQGEIVHEPLEPQGYPKPGVTSFRSRLEAIQQEKKEERKG